MPRRPCLRRKRCANVVGRGSDAHARHGFAIERGPIREQVAWYGPIVMNTQEELRIAFEEYEKGMFIKSERQFKRREKR